MSNPSHVNVCVRLPAARVTPMLGRRGAEEPLGFLTSAVPRSGKPSHHWFKPGDVQLKTVYFLARAKPALFVVVVLGVNMACKSGYFQTFLATVEKVDKLVCWYFKQYVSH